MTPPGRGRPPPEGAPTWTGKPGSRSARCSPPLPLLACGELSPRGRDDNPLGGGRPRGGTARDREPRTQAGPLFTAAPPLLACGEPSPRGPRHGDDAWHHGRWLVHGLEANGPGVPRDAAGRGRGSREATGCQRTITRPSAAHEGEVDVA